MVEKISYASYADVAIGQAERADRAERRARRAIIAACFGWAGVAFMFILLWWLMR
jgi:hypothetical protein